MPEKAPMLVAKELGFSDIDGDSVKIADITDGNNTVDFIARIVSAFEVKDVPPNLMGFNYDSVTSEEGGSSRTSSE